jgi:hypothetical protein
MKESTAYHIEWARRVMKAFHEQQRSPAPIVLGDLVWPLKMSVSWPLVVVDPQYSKTGVVNLDTGEPKYFGSGFMGRVQGLRTDQSSVH